jgi:hypothetical protein
MIACEKHKATIPESTCIARHKGLAKAQKTTNGWIKSAAIDYENCRDCEMGLKLYNNFLKGAKPMDQKVCTKCGKQKSVDQFYKMAASKDGHHPYCKRCHNLYNEDRLAAKKPEPKKQEIIPAAFHKESVKIICAACGEGKLRTKEFFHACKANKSGFDNTCKACRNNEKKIRRGAHEYAIILDFTDHPEVLEKVRKWADDNMRAVDKQILFSLKNDILAG